MSPTPRARRASTRPTDRPFDQESVAALDNLSGELYRKFCARCHIARQNDADDGAGHPAGCAACHMPYGDAATYHGGDRAMRGKMPHSPTHQLRGLPPMDACTRCHNRSGRIGLSYQGLNDGNNGLVPTRAGLPGPVAGGEGRSFTHIAPDVHFEGGMECIDCHTSREIMGDGYAAADMHGQLEIRCENCHGDGLHRPDVRGGGARERSGRARIAAVQDARSGPATGWRSRAADVPTRTSSSGTAR